MQRVISEGELRHYYDKYVEEGPLSKRELVVISGVFNDTPERIGFHLCHHGIDRKAEEIVKENWPDLAEEVVWPDEEKSSPDGFLDDVDTEEDESDPVQELDNLVERLENHG